MRLVLRSASCLAPARPPPPRRRPPLRRHGQPSRQPLDRDAERVGEDQKRRQRWLAAPLLEVADVRAALGLARTMFARGGLFDPVGMTSLEVRTTANNPVRASRTPSPTVARRGLRFRSLAR